MTNGLITCACMMRLPQKPLNDSLGRAFHMLGGCCTPTPWGQGSLTQNPSGLCPMNLFIWLVTCTFYNKLILSVTFSWGLWELPDSQPSETEVWVVCGPGTYYWWLKRGQTPLNLGSVPLTPVGYQTWTGLPGTRLCQTVSEQGSQGFQDTSLSRLRERVLAYLWFYPWIIW